MSFLDISLQTCGDVYPVVRKNAERHFRTTKILSTAKEYPNAVAHLILGTEELIKSFVLFLEHKQFNLRVVKGYKKIFYSHSARHSILKEFFSVWVGVKQLLEIKEREKKENGFLYYLNIAKIVFEGFLSGINNHEWWNEADKLKQNCFYVDYLDQIISPDIIGMKKFKEAEKHVMAFRTDIRILMAVITKANEKQLIQFRKTFEEAEFKLLIQESIERSGEKRV
jgi:AbiV family abortive infection protein